MTPFDVQLEDGDLPKRTDHIDGPEQIAQRLSIKLNTWRGEWFADQRVGQPWLDWKQDKNLDLTIVAAQVRAQILQTPGVTGVVSLDVSRSGGSVSAEGVIEIEDGDRVLEAELFGPEGNAQPVAVLIV